MVWFYGLLVVMAILIITIGFIQVLTMTYEILEGLVDNCKYYKRLSNIGKQYEVLQSVNAKLVERNNELEKENKDLKEELKW